ncbi:hypothetical protein V1512DRAFT_257852 [Lipomyces arxii]|uniref:uncharacterized protein n=1 Tax=Lipomyces arxii TaxID=56418 RepID=UPI0034CDAA7A
MSVFVTKENFVPRHRPQSFDDFPSYDDLLPTLRFWGAWGPPGSDEESLGMLNMLTPDLVARTVAKEVKTGERVGLGWEFHMLDYPNFKRIQFDIQYKWVTYPFSFDDEYRMNPQQSSQWDGFRHHSQMLSHEFGPRQEYMTVDDPDKAAVWHGGTSAHEIQEGTRLSLHSWSKQGIAGRGVLLDYASWAEEQGITYSTFDYYGIPVEDLLKVAERYNVKFEPGDILLVRLGVTKEWMTKSTEWKENYRTLSPPTHAGMIQSEALLRFIWDNHFTAIVSDAIGWELFPNKNPDHLMSLHQTVLAGWGVPIGELFDLDGLSELCKKHDRYSFFFSSVPFNAIGAVSSPPNAMAIF